ncbi:anthranilate phosphoribosyltransferase [Paenibacillus thermoaerophilus]|uniref:Anthranilate phosphoribosyltransferase n=1 Tax=Paenibacillus thermoaerophilus TaxID=1215385 RepID=A0ABW2V4V8_9BACL|nr:anthranilate phosphoribosyltransferase [Paenibacillus thermoaerophilus]TMV18701.1 anthranilate phosphoribosyltransferase [Paenibacillus thermoaerophilus]
MEKLHIQRGIARIVDGKHLNREEARAIMEEILEGAATPAQIGSLMTALRMKGETAEEIAGFAEVMRAKSLKVVTSQHNLLDTCGTGGDGAETFNISTTSALVAAGGGVRVAKHGNRAMSSKSGSADVLEALGVGIQQTPEQAAACLERTNICFMFAQSYHQSMKYAAAPRREVGIRTVFNLLGPLTNPAGADRQLIGLFDISRTETVADVLRTLGVKRALVVASYDGLDEISISAPTRVTELKDGELRTFDITPEELGLTRYPLETVKGGDAVTNAAIIRSVLNGERGARRDIVLANAGACFYVTGMADSLAEGVALAAETIDSGRALSKLEQFVAYTEENRYVS